MPQEQKRHKANQPIKLRHRVKNFNLKPFIISRLIFNDALAVIPGLSYIIKGTKTYKKATIINGVRITKRFIKAEVILESTSGRKGTNGEIIKMHNPTRTRKINKLATRMVLKYLKPSKRESILSSPYLNKFIKQIYKPSDIGPDIIKLTIGSRDNPKERTKKTISKKTLTDSFLLSTIVLNKRFSKEHI